MHLWRSYYDPKTRTHSHTVKAGLCHELLSQAIAYTFRTLRVSTAIWDGTLWWPIHVEPSILTFEEEYGTDPERAVYNRSALAQAVRTKKVVRGEHVGYVDWFQPVVMGDRVEAVLVTGPIALSRPSAADVSQRWRKLTGRLPHLNDPILSSYLRRTLSNLVLDQGRDLLYERLLACFAGLLARSGAADELANEADRLRAELEQARHVDKAWAAVHDMLDERSPYLWQSGTRVFSLRALGLSRMPDHILVGLSLNRARDPDPVDAAIRHDAFQRAAVELASNTGETVAGQVGDHGVVFLSAPEGAPRRRRQKLMDLAEKATALARKRFGLDLHCGANVAPEAVALGPPYRVALGAAQAALTQGSRLIVAEPSAPRATHSLRHLHEELARIIEQRPDAFGARFHGYLEAVASHCGYRVELAQAHLEVGFDRISEALLKSGTLDPKSFEALRSALDRAASEARTLDELFNAHRQAVSDLVTAARSPVPARQDRSLRSALDYINQHYGERLDLKSVARIAGFSAAYFSELFRKREKLPFEQYVRALRLERARQSLASTDLEVTRVATRSGFNSLQYFCRVFRQAFGVSPAEYRRNSRKGGLKPKAGPPRVQA